MTAERYSIGAVVLHWTTALLLAFQLGMGWHMTSMPKGGAMFAAYQLHKSVGILILLLSLARLGLRYTRPRPAEIDGSLVGRWLARGVHAFLYGFMIGGPLTGWAVVSTARLPVPTRLFGLIGWPHLPLDRGWNGLAEALHEQIAWLGVALIALHFAGAMRHHLGGGNKNVLGRMAPALAQRGMPSTRRSFGVATVAVAALALCFTIPWFGFRNVVEAPLVVAAASSPSSAAPTAPAKAAPQPGASEAPAEADAAQLDEATEIAPARWRIEPGGRLGFTASMNGAAIAGRFDKWSADILFGPEALEASRITVRIGLLSAGTADSSRDEMLRGPDFFGSAGPQAVYASRSIGQTAPGRYRIDGFLTMNGKSNPVPLFFTLKIAGDRATASGTASLDRTAFGIGRGEWSATDQVAGKVDVDFSFHARRGKQE